MLDLNEVRLKQASRATLERFFVGRNFSKDPTVAARQAQAFEEETGQQFTFLTVTNRGAYSMNMQCLRLDSPDVAAALDAGRGYPADTSSGQDRILVEVGMRLRLTRNMDKDRGFVNGNLGTVLVTKLRPDVFVVKTMQGVLILVHPVAVKGYKLIPACYAYATAMRRAQGATLPAACLWFDRRRLDRGYAYVGTSRVKPSIMPVSSTWAGFGAQTGCLSAATPTRSNYYPGLSAKVVARRPMSKRTQLQVPNPRQI